MSDTEIRADLLARLQTAAILEVATIPPYMVALLSMKHHANRGAAENIRSVMMEEMLHLTLVANLMSSLGGKLQLTGARLPTYPLRMTFQGQAFKDREFDIELAPFSREAVRRFMEIELPRAAPIRMELEVERIVVPGYTIGEFYQSIIDLLDQLHDSIGDTMFVNPPAKQISADYYWSAGGKPIVVTDIESAKRALNIVIEQGEGSHGRVADGDYDYFGQLFEVAHYYRFKEIEAERRYQRGDRPDAPPTGAAMTVDYTAVYPILESPTSAAYSGTPHALLNDAFNRQYSEMMTHLEEALNGNPKLLYVAIMDGMHGLSELARKMMSEKIQGDALERHGCPTFEWVEAS